MSKRTISLVFIAMLLESCGGSSGSPGGPIVAAPVPTPTATSTPTPPPPATSTPTPVASPVNPIATAFRIDSTDSSSSQPAVAALANGGFVVVWQDVQHAGDVQAAIFDAVGRRERSFRVNATTTELHSMPAIAALDTGGFAIAWIGGTTVRSQTFDASGVRVGAELRTGSPTGRPSIADLTGPGYVIGWNSATGATYTPMVQVLSEEGNPRSASIAVTRGGDRYSPVSLATLPSGSFAVLFGRSQTLDLNGVAFQVRNNAGELVGSEVRTDYLAGPATAYASAGSRLAIYGYDVRRQDLPGVLRLYSGDGSVAATGTSTSTILRRVALTSVAGGFLVTGSSGDFSTGSLQGVLLDAAGQQAGTSTTIGTSSNIDFPAVATLRNGQVIAVWLDVDASAIMGQILATRQPS